MLLVKMNMGEPKDCKVILVDLFGVRIFRRKTSERD